MKQRIASVLSLISWERKWKPSSLPFRNSKYASRGTYSAPVSSGGGGHKIAYTFAALAVLFTSYGLLAPHRPAITEVVLDGKCDRPGKPTVIREKSPQPRFTMPFWGGLGRVLAQAISGTARISGTATIGHPASLVIAVISDEHLEFDPWSPPVDTVVGGATTPATVANKVRAQHPDYILVAGDQGHDSTREEEYRGFWVVSTGAVTAGLHTFTVNGGLANGNTVVFGDPNLNQVAPGTWAAFYDAESCAAAPTYEFSQIVSTTSSTVTVNFSKPHASGFIGRASTLTEYYDYHLCGKLLQGLGNHDVISTDLDFCGHGSGITCAAGAVTPNWLSTYEFWSPNPFPAGSPFPKSWYTTRINDLLTVITLDSNAGTVGDCNGGDRTGGGIDTGCPQYNDVISTMTTPDSVWSIVDYHYPGRAGCISSTPVMPWTIGDVIATGHTHCTRRVTWSGAPSTQYVDVSGYTYMAHAVPSGGGADCTAICSGCTVQYADDGTIRTYGLMRVSPHALVWESHRNTDDAIVDTFTLNK